MGKSLYEQDYRAWLELTTQQLKDGQFHLLDIASLVEELISLGNHDKHAVSSYLMRLCEYLLKVIYWEAERENCLRGWLAEIICFRAEIERKLASSPSLKPYLKAIFVKEYQQGRKIFLAKSGLTSQLIPTEPPFSLEFALTAEYPFLKH